MLYKKKATPGTAQFNKSLAKLPEKKAQVQFRHDILESQRRVNYQNEFDRLQGSNKIPGLDTKTGMQ